LAAEISITQNVIELRVDIDKTLGKVYKCELYNINKELQNLK